VSVFGAVFLFGVFLDLNQSERRRAVRLLESQVAGTQTDQVNLREQALSESFGRRILVPIVAGATRVARRVTPIDARDRVARKLQVAGSPAGWDAERILAFKIIGLAAGAALGIFLTTLLGDLSPLVRIVMVGLLTFVGFVAPDTLLNRRVDERQREILKTLSDTLDLLTISVEAGLSLNAAIAQVVQNVPGVLSSEFARMLQEIQLGVPRADAFRNLAERTDVEELNAFALAMIQADVFGVSIASVLRTQAQQLRIKRRQRAEAKAQQTPVKIVFPLILCILPALFVVIVGPGAIRIFESFIQT
jgi:tight adherence protein C